MVIHHGFVVQIHNVEVGDGKDDSLFMDINDQVVAFAKVTQPCVRTCIHSEHSHTCSHNPVSDGNSPSNRIPC